MQAFIQIQPAEFKARAEKLIAHVQARGLNGVVLVLLVLLGVALLPRVAFANAGPPPSNLRFEFDYETSEAVTLEGAQLLACEGEGCAETVLVGSYGTCEAAPCVTDFAAAAAGGEIVPIECTREACEYDGEDRYVYRYRLVLQLSDGTRESRVFDATTEPYRVRVQDDGLVVRSVTSEPYGVLAAIVGFFPALLFTWVIEGTIAYLFLRSRKTEVPRLLLWLFVLHLATIPMVWTFFPAMSWAPRVEERTFAPPALGLIVLMAGVALLYRSGRLSRWGVLGAVVLGLVGVPLLASLGGQGFLRPPILDFSRSVATVLSEIFVFVFEGWFLYTISRGLVTRAGNVGEPAGERGELWRRAASVVGAAGGDVTGNGRRWTITTQKRFGLDNLNV